MSLPLRTPMVRALLLWVMLALVIPAAVWAQLPSTAALGTAPLLAVVLLLYCASRLALIAWRGELALLAITFFVFVYVWGGLSALAQTSSGIYPWMIRHGDDEPLWGLLQILLAVLAYDLGRRWVRRSSLAPPLALAVEPRRVLVLLVLALGLGLVGMMLLGGPGVLLVTRGGYSAWVSSQVSSQSTALIGGALLRTPAFIAFLLLLGLVVRGLRGQSRANRQALLLGLGAAALLLLLFNFPLSLARQTLGTIALAIAFVVLRWRRDYATWIPAGLVLVTLFVFPYADAFRNALSLDQANLDRELRRGLVHNLLNTGDYDVFQQTLNGRVATERLGHTHGRNLLAAGLFWVPRRVWPEKPLGTGVETARAVGYPQAQQNLSAPLWMEAQRAAGWLGVAALLLLYGWASAALDQRFQQDRREWSRLSLYGVMVPYLAGYQFILLRGDLLNGVAHASVALALLWLVSRPRRRPHPAAWPEPSPVP